MWKFDHRELSDAEHEADNCCIPLARTQKDESRNHDVPHCGKAVEPHVFRFLICAGKPQCACHQDKTRDGHRHARFNDVHANKKHSRHNYTGHVINDKVKHVAVDMWCMETDLELTGNWPIDSIKNLTHNEPQESRAYVPVNDRLQCDEAGKGSAGRENVNAEPGPALGLGGF